jgi:filamin
LCYAVEGDVAIALTNERGLDIPVKTVDMKDNTFRIEFEPASVGTYTANVFFADQEIPSSPYKIKVEPSIDVGRVVVQGLDDSKSRDLKCKMCSRSFPSIWVF